MKIKSGLLMLGIVFAAMSLTACGDDDDDDNNPTGGKDLEKPAIVNEDSSEPKNCEVYHRGETIAFKYKMTDNKELGNFNIEIHNNFDHHTHSTEAGICDLDPIKDPVNPWIYNKTTAIPAGLKEYAATVSITIPGDIDPGDYHFMIRLTDASGWQQLKAVSVKILE